MPPVHPPSYSNMLEHVGTTLGLLSLSLLKMGDPQSSPWLSTQHDWVMGFRGEESDLQRPTRQGSAGRLQVFHSHGFFEREIP